MTRDEVQLSSLVSEDVDDRADLTQRADIRRAGRKLSVAYDVMDFAAAMQGPTQSIARVAAA